MLRIPAYAKGFVTRQIRSPSSKQRQKTHAAAHYLYHYAWLTMLVVAGVAGLFSALSLIRHALPPNSLVPAIDPAQDWLHTYDHNVSALTERLFSWTHIWWLGLSPAEGHILIIGFAILLAIARATGSSEQHTSTIHQAKPKPWIMPVLFVLLFFFVVWLPLTILPAFWGELITAINLSALIAATYLLPSRYNDSCTRPLARVQHITLDHSRQPTHGGANDKPDPLRKSNRAIQSIRHCAKLSPLSVPSPTRLLLRSGIPKR